MYFFDDVTEILDFDCCAIAMSRLFDYEKQLLSDQSMIFQREDG